MHASFTGSSDKLPSSIQESFPLIGNEKWKFLCLTGMCRSRVNPDRMKMRIRTQAELVVMKITLSLGIRGKAPMVRMATKKRDADFIAQVIVRRQHFKGLLFS